MSRLERREEEKIKKISKRPKYRLIFILIMSCLMVICIFLIDQEANIMIGKIDKYNIEVFIENINSSFIKSIKGFQEKLREINNLREY